MLHAIRRYHRRYGKPLCAGQFRYLCRALHGGRWPYRVLRHVRKGRLLIEFRYQRMTTYAIFDPRNGMIITFYTAKMARTCPGAP